VVSRSAFRHEALLYAGATEFLEGTMAFVRDAIRHREPILVIVDAPKIAALKARLDTAAEEEVQFADMGSLGRNPARIIPAWRAFADQHRDNGRQLRGVGEPIWAGRSDTELVECRQHEALINLALDDLDGLWLLCPYDTTSLDPTVVEQAHGTHPFLRQRHDHRSSGEYQGVSPAGLLSEPLPDPPDGAIVYPFGPALAAVRRFAALRAIDAGWEEKAPDVALVVGELATNTLRHSGGEGTLRMWRDGGALICEVRDQGRIVDSMVGRRQPVGTQLGGRGLWLVNQLCDLVQVRSTSAGTTVRVHIGGA
jgi:anti-sigma regulatory factor (Ser/Thr protein kinase)